MLNLNKKYFGLSLLTWVIIGFFIVYLYFCKKCKEDFSSQKNPKTLKAYNFNTTWCGYSVRFQPVWDKFQRKMKNKNIEVLDIKCDNHDDPRVKELCGKYNVEGFPTVVFAKGDKAVHYNGERNVKKLEEFALSMMN